MAITIDKAFVQQYADIVRHLAQQGDARLRPYVYEVPLRGEAYNFDRLAETAAAEKTGRRQATTYIDDTWSRRVAQPKTYNHTMTVEHEDKVQMLVDPENAYAQNQAMAMKRSQDDLIIAAALGNALDGDGNNQTFPAAQKVGDGTAVVTLNNILDVNQIFQANDIDPDEPRVLVVSPRQVRTLLEDTKLTSADYMTVKALAGNGMVPNFLGFTWILSNRLLTTGAAATLADRCIAFTRRAIGLAVNQDTFTRITENPSLQYMIQVFSQWTMGAVRVEDEHIVELHVKQV